MPAFPEVTGRRVPFPEVEPAEAGFLESLPQVPEQLLRLALGAAPHMATENISRGAYDIAQARGGDFEAAKRVRARGTAVSTIGALIPGGPAVQAGRVLPALAARAALGAAGGGISAGLEAGATDQPIVPAVGSGAVLGATLNPLAGLAGKAVQRLMGRGRPVPPRLLEDARREAEGLEMRELAQKFLREGTLSADEMGRMNVLQGRAVEQAADPVERLNTALKEVPDLRTEQEKLFRIERGKRIRAFQTTGQEVAGEAGARAQLRTLGGELPKVEFGTLRGMVDQADVDHLFDMVKTSPLLTEWEKPRAYTALLDLFQPEGVKLPQRSQLEVLEKVFGPRLVETLIQKRGALGWLQRNTMELLALPRTLSTSYDLSAPLRQGIYLGAGHPREFVRAFKTMLTQMRTEEGARALELEIAQRQNYGRMVSSGLALTRSGSVVGRQEEVFMGRLARRIPGVKFSERTYTGFLNKLRADVFDSMLKDASRSGLDIDDPKVLREIAAFVNAGSGRGNLPGFLQKHGDALNQTLFSPRLVASRIQLLNPKLYVSANPIVRKHAIRSALAMGSLATTVLQLAKLAGADVETDPESPDWAKARVGNSRYDILGGFQQYLRLGARMFKGITEAEGFSRRVVAGVKPTGKFIEQKLAPIPGLIVRLWQGQDFRGRPLNVPLEVTQRFTPMVLQDTAEAVQEWGWMGVPVAAPTVFGVGVQTDSD